MAESISNNVTSIFSSKAHMTGRCTPFFSDFMGGLPFAQKHKRDWKTEKSNLERHVLPYLGLYRLSDITTEGLMGWTNKLKLTGLTCSSCCQMFRLAKYVLNGSVRRGILPSSAMFKDASLPTKPGRTPNLLNSSSVRQLLEILKKYRYRDSANAIHLILLTVASKSEILYAHREDMDFERGPLFIGHTFTGRPSFIFLKNEAMKLVQKLSRRNDVSWLFFTRNGNRLQSVSREWLQIRELLGRTELRRQELRHAFANFLVSIDINQRDMHRIWGHYKPETLALVLNNALANKSGEVL